MKKDSRGQFILCQFLPDTFIAGRGSLKQQNSLENSRSRAASVAEEQGSDILDSIAHQVTQKPANP